MPDTHPFRRAPVRALALVAAGMLLALPACKPSDPAFRASTLAASPAGGRAAAAQQIAADWAAGTLRLDECIDLGQEMLESAASGSPFRNGPPTPSADATAFAGAVLDAASLLDAKLPKDDNSQLFWMRLGRLAFRGAEEAHAAGRLAEASSIMLAGPQRWQGEGYWYMYPDHDGLVAVILAKSGRRSEAIARLQNRVDLKGVALEVYEMLQRGQ
ncbi:MAG: hypothetical protein SFY69_10915 [Planctomycetota bacterium]|nr:hypothetical protein [Planctomycetota bacterium]